MDAAKLDFDVLKAMTKELNAATYEKDGVDTSFLPKKIKAIAVTKEGLAKAFDTAIQSIDADVVNDLPEAIIDYYNENFVSAEPEAEAEAEPEPEPEPEKKPTKKKAEKEAKPAGEKKKAPGHDIPLSCFGHQQGSQAAALDDLLAPGKPISLDDLSKKSGRSPLGVKSHIKHLIDARSLTISEKDGVYQLVIKK